MSKTYEIHSLSAGAPRIAILGGSGLYRLPGAERLDELEVPTPFGAPSGLITIALLSGKSIAFLSRHGSAHGVAPQQINYRANLWALKSLGVEGVISSSAVGSLVASHGTDTFAVPDQLIDRTWGRADTYYDGTLPTGVQHLPAAEPYCAALRGVVITALEKLGEGFRDHGTVAVINGPRFATRAESEILAAGGAHLISMTQYPEPVLAAELNMGFANLSYVTDANTGHDGSASVTAEIVLARLEAAQSRILAVLGAVTELLETDYVGPQLMDSAAVRRVLEYRPPSLEKGPAFQQQVQS
ncbi:MTAP family purine nucleoside phosphorylase [Arthrobacter alpinus]|uniref:MTAP family purine nucleoside phosphorylase n=1 Tax=Arthrobacter alpinus TaxID=656366 RepID=UPI001647E379|nr:MTAP family purine nucleoside phosphorylase [Arthrobacter alpinus]